MSVEGAEISMGLTIHGRDKVRHESMEIGNGCANFWHFLLDFLYHLCVGGYPRLLVSTFAPQTMCSQSE